MICDIGFRRDARADALNSMGGRLSAEKDAACENGMSGCRCEAGIRTAGSFIYSRQGVAEERRVSLKRVGGEKGHGEMKWRGMENEEHKKRKRRARNGF